MRAWWAVVAIAAVAIAFLVPLLQTQQRMTEVRGELGRANEQLTKAREKAHNLESTVAKQKAELDESDAFRSQLQTNLEQAHSEIEQKKQNESYESELKDKLAQVEGFTGELEKAKKAANQAKAELAKREKQIAELNEQLASERKSTRSQIETLNTALEEAKAKLSDSERRVAV